MVQDNLFIYVFYRYCSISIFGESKVPQRCARIQINFVCICTTANTRNKTLLSMKRLNVPVGELAQFYDHLDIVEAQELLATILIHQVVL